MTSATGTTGSGNDKLQIERSLDDGRKWPRQIIAIYTACQKESAKIGGCLSLCEEHEIPTYEWRLSRFLDNVELWLILGIERNELLLLCDWYCVSPDLQKSTRDTATLLMEQTMPNYVEPYDDDAEDDRLLMIASDDGSNGDNDEALGGAGDPLVDYLVSGGELQKEADDACSQETGV